MYNLFHQRIPSSPPKSGGGYFRRGWAMVLFLLALLPFSQTAQAVETSNPSFYDWSDFNFPSKAHVSFRMYFYNYDGKNSWFKGDVWLKINDQKVIKLNSLYSNISNLDQNEDAVKDKSDGGVLGQGSFNANGYKGRVSVARLNAESDKWSSVTVDIILEELIYNKSYKVTAEGEWISKGISQGTKSGSKTFSFPTVDWAHLKVKRTANNEVEFYSTDLKVETYPNFGSKNNPGNWRYALRFSSINNTDVAWPSNTYTIKKYWDNINITPVTVNSSLKDCNSGITQVHATLELDNYKSFCVYPFITRFAPNYQCYPNGGSTALTQSVYINRNYKPHWVYGYPRPNPSGYGNGSSTAANAMRTSANPWTKDITISWYPQIYDASHVNTDGKWVVFRKVRGESGDYTSLGTVSYSSGKTEFVDKTDKEYGKEYVYTVAFQPTEWGKTLSQPSDASSLSCYVYGKVTTVNPLEKLTATNNLDAKINITCSYKSFENASTSTKYTLNLYRRKKGTTDWGEVYKSHTINSNSETSFTFTDEDVSNACVTYQYKVSVEAQEMVFEYGADGTVEGCIDGASGVKSVVASRGAYSGTVRITWEVNQIGTDLTYFNVQRRLLGSTKEGDFQTIYTTSGVAETYSYEDNSAQPGSYYEYRVQCYRKCRETSTSEPVLTYGASQQTDGFALATGVISGRVTYGTGTAVDGVKVSLEPSSKDDNIPLTLHALRKNSGYSYVRSNQTPGDIKEMLKEPWTMQMYFKVDNFASNSTLFKTQYTRVVIDNNGWIGVIAPKTNNGQATSLLRKCWQLETGKFYSISLSYDGDKLYTLRLIDESGNMKKNDATLWGSELIYLGYTDNHFSSNECYFEFGSNYSAAFTGVIDECRFWTKELTDAMVLNNYNRILSGSEDGLYLYYKFDEGISSQTIAYDYSKKAGVSNGNHGIIYNMNVTDDVPSENQLAICGITDENGSYSISGIPFSGDGTSYTIRPSKGIHEFSPTKETRFVSAQSLVHNGVDFEDVSSFPVSGTVYYYGTNIPVEGVQFSVDGSPCTKDGEFITTNSDGEFTISVPIGSHYISASKDGHSLINANEESYNNKAYYPGVATNGKEIVIGTKDFVQELTGLTFYDNTLVPIAGRVTGGAIENDKPLGLGQSVNNIGRATLTLKYGEKKLNIAYKKDGATSSIEDATENRYFDVPEDATCSSKAYVGYGSDDKAGSLIITTDSLTGEFAAMVPPLNYTVAKVSIDSNDDIFWTEADILDASNPLQEYTDSAEVKGNIEKFTYVASLKKSYRSTPVLNVVQKDAAADGAFGEQMTEVTAANGDKVKVQLYDTNKTYSLPTEENTGYTFGYPVFLQNAEYEFDLSLYEQYENHDSFADESLRKTIVPLSGTTVTFSNQMGVGTSVIVSGEDDGKVYESATTEIELDENGKGSYSWRAALPNIIAPYTRTMTATYSIEGTTLSWDGSGFQGIILGELTSGNNFVTAGPDEVAMILRDPAGSGSSAYIEEGQSTTTTVMRGGQIISNNEVMTNTKFGLKTTTISGGIAVGVLVATSIDVESKFEMKAGLKINEEVQMGTTNTRTITTTKRISTSDETEYVGAVGDVFIGSSTNYVFGNARQIGINLADAESVPALDLKNVMTVGTSFSTEFLYTQNYVESSLLPNFEKLRNSCLVHVDSYDGYVNNTDKPIYITKLNPGDKGYGSNNSDKSVWGDNASVKGALEGPSYKMVLPASAYKGGTLRDDYLASDTITWFNSQISAWKQVLANNEKAKVKAIENRSDYLRDNYSFDAGSSLTSSTTTTSSKDFTVTSNTSILAVVGGATGFQVNSTGIEVEASTETGGSVMTSDGSTEESSMEVGFTLAESGDDDALTVDVLNAPDGFGPIFYTRAGQTSCPYEDAVETKYYRPGFVIQEKTMQIEQPRISAKETTMTGVPSGKPATYTVYMQNTSEIGEDCWFNLNVVDQSNPDGAAVTMDGKNLSGGTTVLLKAGETLTKTIQISQTNSDVYDYEGIQLRISSVCQSDNNGVFPEIADTVVLSAHFQQTGSSVALKAEENSLNIETGHLLHLTISDYDKNSRGLKSLRLQAKQEGNPQWTTLKEWVVDETEAANDVNKEVLPAEGTFGHVLDMSDANVFPDGQWNIRAITVSNFGGNEVTNSSDVIMLSKDMIRPQLITTPSPANGVLTADDEIAVTFNEDIRYGALTTIDNFVVTGELNDATIAHDVAMSLTGGEGAKTSASMNLDKRSFAVNMWMRYSKPGEIFAHGTADNNMKVAVNDEGKLTINMAGSNIVSENALQKDTWQYLSFSYNADNKTITANYAYDAYDVTLFNEKPVGEYTGVGTITLGKGLTGQMHDVSLWNNARPWSEAQGEMYEKKTRYSEGLMGYWRLDEGHGTAATDYARSRTLTLPSATAWYLAGTNYALNLDGDAIMAINAAAIAGDNSDSYTIEMWFRADNSQKGKASIVGYNSNNKLDIYLSESGQLRMTANAKDYAVSSKDYRDNQWHHLAFNVLKSTSGSATLYVDGIAGKQFSATEAPALQTSKLILGGHLNGETFDQPFKGAIDEVRVWHGHRTADVINNNMYARVSNDAEGLVAYYPFEKATLDAGNQMYTDTTACDQSTKAAGNIMKIEGLGNVEYLSQNTAPLKTAPVRQNVGFSFTGSDRKILIKLTDSPQRLENCTVNITVRGVRDTHNNPCNSITWDVYVRQNQLIWQESEMSIVKHGAESVGFEVGITNNSGSAENWTISNLPSWLSVSSGTGTLPAISERTLKFTVDPSLSIGNYEAVVYLTGSLGISEPLVVKVSSTSQTPDWSVNPADYEYTMNINGQLVIADRMSQDGNDIIAAFRGDRCVGVASPTYFERYDAYYVLMNVYGNNEDFNQPLTYKVFDASTGNIHPVVKASIKNVTTFVPDVVIGTMNNPNIWTATNEIGQDINLVKGWQWISMYVNPSDNDADEVLAGIQDNLSSLVSEYALWTPISSTLSSINVGEMYKAQLSAPATLTVSGLPVDVASTPLTIKPQWNWIGYMAPGYISLGEAFADLDPQDGDVIKGHKSFATWNQNEWVGTLTTMAAGEGYQYFSSRDNAKQFCYPSLLSDGTANAKAMTSAEAKAYAQAQNDIAAAHSGNMTVIATVLDFNGMARNNVEVRVIDADNNLRAISREAVADRHFITIAGEEHGAALRFIVNIDGMDYIVPGVMFYNDDAIIGTYNEPLVIDLSSPTGIGNIAADNDGDENTYNLAGQRIDNTMRRQVVIRGNKKVVVRK
ncbi:LamG-like jellyroll fold domain-containing protein [Prevotella sp. P3-122]|uniref:LamG-like jellyroll fold domain-containing protein n=1 Tax=Prevotella sp. P3-122 TaxID=2024223 RepID=UPI000BC93960|nr:LamG-like jellyroll fold domain-containing protein [Prevotella sp. P3-122]OYP61876.1 hypothetical protein CIL02_04270 [Prevotella sp. P3-122]